MSETARRNLIIAGVIAGAFAAILWAALNNWVSAAVCAAVVLAGIALLTVGRGRSRR